MRLELRGTTTPSRSCANGCLPWTTWSSSGRLGASVPPPTTELAVAAAHGRLPRRPAPLRCARPPNSAHRLPLRTHAPCGAQHPPLRLRSTPRAVHLARPHTALLHGCASRSIGRATAAVLVLVPPSSAPGGGSRDGVGREGRRGRRMARRCGEGWPAAAEEARWRGDGRPRAGGGVAGRAAEGHGSAAWTRWRRGDLGRLWRAEVAALLVVARLGLSEGEAGTCDGHGRTSARSAGARTQWRRGEAASGGEPVPRRWIANAERPSFGFGN
ncbi:hypothetical protein PVAP13_9NG403114 [Panicum virgatum]|uniref:Uncharacterized protein n=1 Tax=Panicum virgatum TaxID=38727 RepID=A0A8T0MNC5_PANVG|nr:hypothetical protein PVAP13_9NG403114 [Panicum virgatum]